VRERDSDKSVGAAPPSTDREFARIDVRIRARMQPLDDARAALLAKALLERPSVWTPTGLAVLRDLASGSAPGPSTTLAQAVLETTVEIARLASRQENGTSALHEATIVQLSGGGGRLATPFPLDVDDRIELSFDDDDPEIPPVRALARVVHRHEDSIGFSSEVLHPRDQELVVRAIYGLQRRSLRARQG
jgi:hypothetical protein